MLVSICYKVNDEKIYNELACVTVLIQSKKKNLARKRTKRGDVSISQMYNNNNIEFKTDSICCTLLFKKSHFIFFNIRKKGKQT